MKHIWQSIINKHYGTLQIFVGNRSARKGMDITLVCLKPFCILVNKIISLKDAFNPVDLAEESPQLFTGFSFRIGPEPAHPFPLDMVQTALNNRSRPDQPDSSRNGTFTIRSYEFRVQSLALKITKPGVGFLKGFLLNVDVGNDLLIYPIHQIQQAAVLVKIGGIIKYIADPRIINVFISRLFKPIILDAIKCEGAIARQLLKAPDGIALDNPQLEPMLATVDTVVPLFPDKGAFTL